MYACCLLEPEMALFPMVQRNCHNLRDKDNEKQLIGLDFDFICFLFG